MSSANTIKFSILLVKKLQHFNILVLMGLSTEVLLKRESQYGWLPSINWSRSFPFNIANIVFLLQNKLSYLGG
jgi:hypothetical protein